MCITAVMVTVALQPGHGTPAAAPLLAPQKAHEALLHPGTPGFLAEVRSAWEMDPQTCLTFRDRDASVGCCTPVLPNSSQPSALVPAEIHTTAWMWKGLGFGVCRPWLWGLFCPQLLLEPGEPVFPFKPQSPCPWDGLALQKQILLFARCHLP